MRYDTVTKDLNNSLRAYARAIINDSVYKDKFPEDTLKLFEDWFVRDEIQLGRIKAELSLQENLEMQYSMT